MGVNLVHILIFVILIIQAVAKFISLYGHDQISTRPSVIFGHNLTRIHCAKLCFSAPWCQGFNTRHVLHTRGRCDLIYSTTKPTDIVSEKHGYYYERIDHSK